MIAASRGCADRLTQLQRTVKDETPRRRGPGAAVEPNVEPVEREAIPAIRISPPRPLPGIAWRSLRVERVMGIEPITGLLQINCLVRRATPSAMAVRTFAVRGALPGNVGQRNCPARRSEIDPERSFINVRYQVPWSEAAANEVSAAEI
jgi:hypothetical protein